MLKDRPSALPETLDRWRNDVSRRIPGTHKKVMVWLLGIVGLAIGLLGALVGIAVSGGGHGWNTGAIFNFLGLVLTSIAFAHLGRGRSAPSSTSLGLVICAVVSDVLVVVFTLHEGVGYLHKVGDWFRIWLMCWLPWQISTVLSLIIVATGRRA